MLLATFLFYFYPSKETSGDSGQTVDIGTIIEPTIEITIEGGTNEYGKKTLFSANNIDFGTVSFLHPENITNGDAYIENGLLKLESVLNVTIGFSGVNSVAVNLSKIPVSSNSFAETSYSTSLSRSAIPNLIYTEPQLSNVTNLSSNSTITLRMIYTIKQQQFGKIYDRFRLVISSI